MGSLATTDRPIEIRCGACKGRHPSRHEVKACYADLRARQADEARMVAAQDSYDTIGAELEVERLLEEYGRL